jgi:sensor domain CHASE-containing protein
MTLRKKSVIIIILISLLIISLVNASARFILLKSFSNLEEDYCLKNVQRTFNAIASEKVTYYLTRTTTLSGMTRTLLQRI